jgi:hypothetical protein
MGNNSTVHPSFRSASLSLPKKEKHDLWVKSSDVVDAPRNEQWFVSLFVPKHGDAFWKRCHRFGLFLFLC